MTMMTILIACNVKFLKSPWACLLNGSQGPKEVDGNCGCNLNPGNEIAVVGHFVRTMYF